MTTRRNGTSHTQAKLYTAVIERDGGKCQLRIPGICTGTATTADHIVPVSKGGPDRTDNLRASCQACNQHRNDHDDPITDSDYWSRQWL